MFPTPHRLHSICPHWGPHYHTVLRWTSGSYVYWGRLRDTVSQSGCAGSGVSQITSVSLGMTQCTISTCRPEVQKGLVKLARACKKVYGEEGNLCLGVLNKTM